MFAAIYSFDVKPGEETAFLEAWEALTILIKDHLGGLGSRIHKADEGNEYIAYAQWPNRELWERDSTNLLPKEADLHRSRMRNACNSVKTIYRLEETKDLLVHSR